MSRTAYHVAVGAGPAPDSLSTAQRSALKKTAWRFLPLLTIAYLFNYLDRTAIGFAALTMNQDIGLTNTAVRPRRRLLLPQLYAVRGAEQSRPLPVRRPALDRAHHDQLGHRVGSDRVRQRT